MWLELITASSRSFAVTFSYFWISFFCVFPSHAHGQTTGTNTCQNLPLSTRSWELLHFSSPELCKVTWSLEWEIFPVQTQIFRGILLKGSQPQHKELSEFAAGSSRCSVQVQGVVPKRFHLPGFPKKFICVFLFLKISSSDLIFLCFERHLS